MRWGVDQSVLLRCGGLVALSVVGGGGLHALSPHRVSLASSNVPLACSAPTGNAAAALGPAEVEPAEVLPFCNRPGVVLADARSAALFANGHVAGALHVPCTAGPLSAEKRAALADARTIIVIGESTSAALTAAEALRPYAPEARLQVLRGGFKAWEDAGFACASGPCEECMTSTPLRTAP